MKAGIANSLSARCAGACPFARTEVRMKETASVMVGEGTSVFSKKAGRKKRKEGAFRKKVHKFFIQPLPTLKNRNIFLTKPSIIRN